MAGTLCLVLTPATLDDIFTADLNGADCIEIRLDYLNNPQDALNARWDRFALPVIATCRGKDRGGRFEGSIDEELRILEQAARNGARYVDIDYRFARPVAGAEVIGSYHNFEETPADLPHHLALAMASSAPIVKIATTVNSWNDNRRLFDFLAGKLAKPLIITGMGEMGEITRVIGPARGSFLTYATNGKQSSASGQLPLREMLDIYRFRKLTKNTKLVGILGHPVGHSKSPELHNRAFEATGLDFVYLKFSAADVRDFFNAAEQIGIHGFSVTIPHKTTVIPFLSTMSAAAIEAGAVNTVTRREGKWHGDNTDIYGVRTALASAEFDPSGKRIVILGIGGAARAAAIAVKDASSIVVLSRRSVVQTNWNVNVRFDHIENLHHYKCDLLINATPLGMYPFVDESPLTGLIPAPVVFDMVYNPPRTALLQAAEQQGKITISGMAMFLAQAERQFEIWTGEKGGRWTSL